MEESMKTINFRMTVDITAQVPDDIDVRSLDIGTIENINYLIKGSEDQTYQESDFEVTCTELIETDWEE
jgi:VCBS repeat-containing protein